VKDLAKEFNVAPATIRDVISAKRKRYADK